MGAEACRPHFFLDFWSPKPADYQKIGQKPSIPKCACIPKCIFLYQKPADLNFWRPKPADQIFFKAKSALKKHFNGLKPAFLTIFLKVQYQAKWPHIVNLLWALVYLKIDPWCFWQKCLFLPNEQYLLWWSLHWHGGKCKAHRPYFQERGIPQTAFLGGPIPQIFGLVCPL